MRRILIIEDEQKIAEVVRSYLEREGYNVDIVDNGEEGIRLHEKRPYDLILLDLMLPGMSGEETCRRIRASSRVSIIMLTAKSAEENKIEGLQLGADDYITKPFSPKELVARVAAVLRRSSEGELLAEQLYLPDGLVLDRGNREVRRGEEKIRLTPTEFKILYTLAQNPQRSFRRAELIEKVFGYDFEGDERVIDTHVKNLRRKIESDPKNPKVVLAVYGVGYRLGGTTV
ncbi:response regulator transcription factor [Effusibacillus pohliae]|uniref:response regulator transcription factor n=1 Tax=Effusibacillus pohliae TaxID=232270 RepID=UPI0003730A89|nr:response regulator transcription factor [Effusibacillus pohliae]